MTSTSLKRTLSSVADINIFQRQDQYDEAVMKDRYAAMIDGYPVKQHDELV